MLIGDSVLLHIHDMPYRRNSPFDPSTVLFAISQIREGEGKREKEKENAERAIPAIPPSLIGENHFSNFFSCFFFFFFIQFRAASSCVVFAPSLLKVSRAINLCGCTVY